MKRISKNRIIFHVDLDAFFASCEERESPHFRGKPIVVGADPKQGTGRGVVSTANYTARKFGIHSAMPISQAYRLCPSAIFLPVNGALYSRVSNAVMAILQDFSQTYKGKFEQTSIDEAYIEILGRAASAYNRSYSCDCMQKIANRIRSKILDRERITASIGIGPNMLVAKIASDFQKPNGLTIVKPTDVQKFLDPLPIRKLPGIGPKTETELMKILGSSPSTGAEGATVSHLRKLPQSLLYEHFGRHGISLYESARGIDNRIVGKTTETKSIGEEYTFKEDTGSAREILPILFSLTKNVLRSAQSAGYKDFKTITVKIRYANFKTHTKSLSGNYSIEDINKIEQTALKLLWRFISSLKKIRLIGFRIGRFTKG